MQVPLHFGTADDPKRNDKEDKKSENEQQQQQQIRSGALRR